MRDRGKANGPSGAPKRDAKQQSSKIRRRTAKLEIKVSDLRDGAFHHADRDLSLANEWVGD